MTSPDRCTEQVLDGGHPNPSHRCLNTAKRDGLCGLHLAARDRRAAKQAAAEERRAASDREAVAAREACELLANVGIDATPYYSFGQHIYTGAVVVENPSRLLELL